MSKMRIILNISFLCFLVSSCSKEKLDSVKNLLKPEENNSFAKLSTCKDSTLVGKWRSSANKMILDFYDQCIYVNQFCSSAGIFGHNKSIDQDSFFLDINSISTNVPEICPPIGSSNCHFNYIRNNDELEISCGKRIDKFKRINPKFYPDFEFTRSAKSLYEHVDLTELIPKTCIGNYKIINKTVQTQNLDDLKNISLSNIQDEIEKGIIPKKDEYYDGLGILKSEAGFIRGMHLGYLQISPYRQSNDRMDRSSRNEVGGINFEKYVDINNVIVNKLYEYENVGKGGGTIELQGRNESFKITKENNEYWLNMKSKVINQYGHRQSSSKVEWELRCKFQNEVPSDVSGSKAQEDEFRKKFEEQK